jgi:hypothetical protein
MDHSLSLNYLEVAEVLLLEGVHELLEGPRVVAVRTLGGQLVVVDVTHHLLVLELDVSVRPGVVVVRVQLPIVVRRLRQERRKAAEGGEQIVERI